MLYFYNYIFKIRYNYIFSFVIKGSQISILGSQKTPDKKY